MDLRSQWLLHLKPVEDQVVQIHHHRQIWLEMRAALVAVAEVDSMFLEHYANLYVASQSIAVRRIADPKARNKTASLGGLIRRMLANPEVLSRRAFVEYAVGDPETVGAWDQDDAARLYDNRFGDGGRLEASRFQDHLGKLEAASEAVGKYASKVVAHIDTDLKDLAPVTYSELDASVTTLGEVLTDVKLLLEGVSLATPTPYIQGDWKAPFRSALF